MLIQPIDYFLVVLVCSGRGIDRVRRLGPVSEQPGAGGDEVHPRHALHGPVWALALRAGGQGAAAGRAQAFIKPLWKQDLYRYEFTAVRYSTDGTTQAGRGGYSDWRLPTIYELRTIVDLMNSLMAPLP